jgi:hypothetical protein
MCCTARSTTRSCAPPTSWGGCDRHGLAPARIQGLPAGAERRARGAPRPAVGLCGGDGCYLIDAAGKRYLDGSGGAAVSCLGHSTPRCAPAINAQLDRSPSRIPASSPPSRPRRWPTLLIARRPRGSTGSISSPAAPRRWRRRSSSRGSTSSRSASRSATASSPAGRAITATRWARWPPAATPGAARSSRRCWSRSSHIAPCYEYRDRATTRAPEAYGQRVADELEAEILRLGPETVMAFIAEPVVGATAGAVPPCPATSGASARSATATACC